MIFLGAGRDWETRKRSLPGRSRRGSAAATSTAAMEAATTETSAMEPAATKAAARSTKATARSAKAATAIAAGRTVGARHRRATAIPTVRRSASKAPLTAVAAAARQIIGACWRSTEATASLGCVSA